MTSAIPPYSQTHPRLSTTKRVIPRRGMLTRDVLICPGPTGSACAVTVHSPRTTQCPPRGAIDLWASSWYLSACPSSSTSTSEIANAIFPVADPGMTRCSQLVYQSACLPGWSPDWPAGTGRQPIRLVRGPALGKPQPGEGTDAPHQGHFGHRGDRDPEAGRAVAA